MHRRKFLQVAGSCGILASTGMVGCRGHQFAHVLRPDQADVVGTHSAGAETFNPLIGDAVAQLLGRQGNATIQPAGHAAEVHPGKKAICFVGVENRSVEELGDFRDQIYQQIDTKIVESDVFRPISRRYVDAGLIETRLRPDALFIPNNMRIFVGAMEQMGQPFDYLLYATITSGTTESNHSYQRDYLLTLELVNVHTGHYDKQSAKVRKGYHRSRLGALKKYNPFSFWK